MCEASWVTTVDLYIFCILLGLPTAHDLSFLSRLFFPALLNIVWSGEGTTSSRSTLREQGRVGQTIYFLFD